MTQTSNTLAETDLTALTAPELRKLAAEHNIAGRSKMAKPALLAALGDVQLAQDILTNVAAEQDMTVRIVSGRMPVELYRNGFLAMNFVDRQTAHEWLTLRKRENERRAAEQANTFTVPTSAGYETGITFTGIHADVMRHHYVARERYLKNGRKTLTAAQKRRLQKETNSYARKVGLIRPKVKTGA